MARKIGKTATHKVHEKLEHPTIHDVLVLPTFAELLQKIHAVFRLERGKHFGLQILGKRGSVILVQLLGPVVRTPLGAHFVAQVVNPHVFLVVERASTPIEVSLQHICQKIDAFILDPRPAHLKGCGGEVKAARSIERRLDVACGTFMRQMLGTQTAATPNTTMTSQVHSQ